MTDPVTTQERRLLAQTVALARGIAEGVRVLGWFSLGCGVWLVSLFLISIPLRGWWAIGVGIPALALALLPGAILIAFHGALRAVLDLRDRAGGLVTAGAEGAGDLYRAVRDGERLSLWRRIWRFFRAMIDLRSVTGNGLEMVWQYAAIVRLANPLVMLVVLTAAILTPLMAAVALGSTVILLVMAV